MIAISMMPVELATPALLKMKVFWSNGYNVAISLHDITNITKGFAHDSSLIVYIIYGHMIKVW